MNLRDRLTTGDSLFKDIVSLIDQIQEVVNTLLSVVFAGGAPHKADDTSNQVTASDAATADLESVIDLEKALEAAYDAHLASTTVHIAADSTDVTTNKSVYTKIKTLADELKTDYNAHRAKVSGTCHAEADSTNDVTASAVSSKATAVTLLNQIKAKFNAHCGMTEVHGKTGVYAAIKALADDLKAQYNAHRVLVGTPAAHGAQDAVNDVTAAAVSDKATAVTLVNQIKAMFNAHCADAEAHGTATVLTDAQTLINELKAKYEAHRILTAGGEHGGADSTDVVTVADMTTKESAVALLNDIKAQFNAHCALTAGSVHGAADTVNPVVVADLVVGATWQQIADMADAIRTGYEAHRVLTAGSVHGAADSTNVMVATALGTITGVPDTTNPVATADVSGSSTWADIAGLVDDIRTAYEAHRVLISGGEHGAADATNVTSAPAVGAVVDSVDTTNLVSTADLTSASTWTEIQVMVDAIRTKYEAHRVYITGTVHGAVDSTNTVSALAVGALQTSVNTYLTELKAQFNAHVVYLTSHYVTDATMVVTTAAATTLATSVALSTAIKAAFNNHISRASEVALSLTALDDINM